MTTFYIWVTVFIIIILLLSASAISKIAYDKRLRARRTLVSRQVDVETVHSGNNTVIYTIPATPMIGGHRPPRPTRTTAIYPDRTMTVTRSRTTHVTTEIDDCPPSYEQAVVSGGPQQQQPGHPTRNAV